MIIGVVATSYPRFAGDHAGNFVEGHVRALRTLGHDVEVLAAGHGIPAGDLFYTGGAPDRIERAPIRTAVEGAVFTARMIREIRRRSRRWDAIVAHWMVPCGVAALIARKPLLAIAHGGDAHLFPYAAKLFPQLACVSRELATRLGRPDAIVQPMGIDLARFAAIVPARTTPPTILVVARFVPVKGIDVAIRALDHIDHIRRPVQLVIAGDGPERYADPRVRFVGAVDADARDRLLAQASVVVVPSRVLPNGRTEGTPMIALEALAANVPVVGSRVGGLAELPITTVTPDDPRALAAGIEATLDATPRDHRASIAHLDWKIVAQRLLPTV